MKIIIRILLAIALTFCITPSAFAADTSAPVLVDWKLIDLKTDISNGDGILRIQFSISDESDFEQPLSNVGSTTTTQQTGFAFPKLISKVGNVSTYSAEATVKFGQAPGLWRWLFFPMGDVIGNRSQGFGPGGSWPIYVWVYDKDFTEAKRLATETTADKVAADLKAKQEADAKAAAELKAKQDAAADKAALAKAQSELSAANSALADAQKVNREQAVRITVFEEQFKVLSESVATVQSQLSQLNSKLVAALTGLNTANSKIKKICAAKPKPKGC
jgi:hypothetical protein